MRSTRVVAAVSCLVVGLFPLAGARASAGSRYRVTAAVPATNIAGQAMNVRGRVSPHAGGTYVRVQVRPPGATAFHTVRTARVHRDGRYHAWVRATRPGVTRYRVVEPASRGHRRGHSPVQLVTVSQWRPVASLPRVSGNYDMGTIEPVASMDINGTVYSPALVQRMSPYFGSAWQEYVIDGRCTQLDTWVGTPPAEPGTIDRGSRVLIQVGPDDGSQTFTTATGTNVHYLGHPQELRLGPDVLAHVGLIRLYIDENPGIPVGWGDPKVLCSF